MRRIFWYLLSLCCLAASVTAQTPDATPAPKAAKAAKSKVDPLAKERRETALTIVNELADEARAFRDELLRARVQTRAADVIWDADPERARVLFRRAWDAADAADREALRQREEKARQAQANGGSFAYRSPPNLRNEVLQAATRRDRALGEELLARLDETRPSENSNASANIPPANDTDDPQNLPPALAQRLEAASALLESGEVERAIQFAEPGLAAVTMPGLRFLVHLRQQNAAAADQRYAALLARAANAPNTNANTVSLLSSYIFTPGLFMVISPNGGLATYSSDRQPPVDAPELRLAFLNFAAQILMRPLPPLEQENAKGRRTGIYLVTSRLLPLFEQFAPEHIGVLRAQIAAVTADVSEETRDPRNPWLSRGLTPVNEEGDESATALERAEKAKTPEQRDSLYAVAALSLVSKEPARAYDIADKISDSQLRQQLRSYLDFTSLGRSLNQKNPTEALRLARKGDLTNIQRVWGLTEAAKLLVKTDRAQAVAILEEAALETRRISGADASRVSGLVAVATYFYELDRARAWEFVNEAIKAANSNDDYSGEDSYIQSGVRAKNFASLNNSSVESFDLQGLFRLLAKEDMNRAVQAAKSFTRDAPRANALFAVARQTLAKPGKNREVRQSEQVIN